jgi:FkbM family methyltransferase
MELQENKIFVQIGAAMGDDDFEKDLVRRYKPSMVLLVEPQKQYHPLLKKRYEDIPNVFYEEVAITATHEKEMTLYHQPGWHDCYFSAVPMQKWWDEKGYICKVVVPAMRFNDLCEKWGIKEIELLEIDTEGYDMEIVKSIDFDKIKIRVIIYENWGPSNDLYPNLSDREKYGAEGIATMRDLLISKGYEIEWHSVENERAIKYDNSRSRG